LPDSALVSHRPIALGFLVWDRIGAVFSEKQLRTFFYDDSLARFNASEKIDKEETQ